MSSNNVIHTVGFRVRKYGTAAQVLSNFSNVMLDNVAFVDVFEFGVSISSSVFEENLFESTVFFQDY